MRREQSEIEKYIESCYPPESQQKKLSRQFAESLNLGGISLSQTEAHLMQFLLRLIKPQRIVEIGTLTGLSAQYFLEALENTHEAVLFTLEKSEEHIQKSQEALKPWIENGKCKILGGDARETLKQLEGSFDAIFIDGNKAAYLDYWNWAKEKINSGGLILLDNVFLSGAVWVQTGLKQKFSAKQISIMQQVTREILADEHFYSSFVPTAEGLLVAFKK